MHAIVLLLLFFTTCWSLFTMRGLFCSCLQLIRKDGRNEDLSHLGQFNQFFIVKKLTIYFWRLLSWITFKKLIIKNCWMLRAYGNFAMRFISNYGRLLSLKDLMKHWTVQTMSALGMLNSFFFQIRISFLKIRF